MEQYPEIEIIKDNQYLVSINLDKGRKQGIMTIRQSDYIDGIYVVIYSIHRSDRGPYYFSLNSFFEFNDDNRTNRKKYEEDNEIDLSILLLSNMKFSDRMTILRYPKIKQNIDLKYKQKAANYILYDAACKYDLLQKIIYSSRNVEKFQFLWDHLGI